MQDPVIEDDEDSQDGDRRALPKGSVFRVPQGPATVQFRFLLLGDLRNLHWVRGVAAGTSLLFWQLTVTNTLNTNMTVPPPVLLTLYHLGPPSDIKCFPLQVLLF